MELLRLALRRQKGLHWRALQRRGCHQRIKKPPIIQTRGICILKKEQTPGRITPEFLSMEFHMPWQVGGREI